MLIFMMTPLGLYFTVIISSVSRGQMPALDLSLEHYLPVCQDPHSAPHFGPINSLGHINQHINCVVFNQENRIKISKIKICTITHSHRDDISARNLLKSPVDNQKIWTPSLSTSNSVIPQRDS